MDSMDIPSPSSPRSERDGWTIVDRPAAEPLNGDADPAGEPSRPRAASPEPGFGDGSADLHDELLDGIKSPASESLADDVLREPFQAPGPLQLQAAAAAASAAGAGPVEEPSTPTGASGYHPTAATLAGGSCPDLASAVAAAAAAAHHHQHHHQRHSSQQLQQSQSRAPSDVAAAAAAAFAAMSSAGGAVSGAGAGAGAAGGSGAWSFERHRERLRAASRLSGEGALEGFQDPQDLALEEASAARLSGSSESFGYCPASAAVCTSACTTEQADGAAALLRVKAAAAAAARAKAAAAAGGSATCANAKGSAAGTTGAAAEEIEGDGDDDESAVVTLGWEGLAAGLWADVLRELEDVRALLAAGAGAVWGRLADGQRALEEWAAGVRASARKAAKAAGRSGCPLWALVGVSGLAAVALAALAAQLLVNRKLAAQLRQRDRDLARLVVKILNLQDALQSAARNMTPHLLHAATAAAGGGGGGAGSGRGALGPHLLLPATTTLIGMV
ncbi:hypothetical protein HYH02_013544 [Chlamydomonas schloesseri]|uniref:Uncharacterized protein n=1 Tax=Chlamydomonas schloesseri TaxID=2026947 RepID=A0A835T373_9CHLO|nr:hypothetical protein HYH02_013544 [Chlamydomonas schloesseri]|eukprot:KAG2431015.1 hypothetical protein HYH02_013544 [Chlamydomonas schloesseri]